MNKKMPTLFEQVIITAQRTRELREERYGALDTGMFDPSVNKRLPRLVNQAINEVETGVVGREHLIKCVERVENKRQPKKRPNR